VSEESNIPGENSKKQIPNSEKEQNKTISEPQPPAVAESLPQAQQPQPLPIAIGTQPEIMETHAHHLHKSPAMAGNIIYLNF